MSLSTLFLLCILLKLLLLIILYGTQPLSTSSSTVSFFFLWFSVKIFNTEVEKIATSHRTNFFARYLWVGVRFQANTGKKYISDISTIMLWLPSSEKCTTGWKIRHIYTKIPLQALWVLWLMVFKTAGFTVHNCAGIQLWTVNPAVLNTISHRTHRTCRGVLV